MKTLLQILFPIALLVYALFTWWLIFFNQSRLIEVERRVLLIQQTLSKQL